MLSNAPAARGPERLEARLEPERASSLGMAIAIVRLESRPEETAAMKSKGQKDFTPKRGTVGQDVNQRRPAT